MNRNREAGQERHYSPDLILEEKRDYVDPERTRGGYYWLCKEVTERFFDLKGARRIRLYSVSLHGSDVYTLRLHRDGRLLVPGHRGIIYFTFGGWAAEQIRAGRPHIGIELYVDSIPKKRGG